MRFLHRFINLQGITWDAVNNSMTATMYAGDGRRMRLDRVTMNHTAKSLLEPILIDIFAREKILPGDPYYDYVTPSDHYGLFADFHLKL